MESTSPAHLNQRFGIRDTLDFGAGPGALTVADISNSYATARVSLAGGHVLSYQPHDAEPVLWLSRCSNLEPGKPIRGGIPLCWPWFGSHPQDRSKPFHGFARVSVWSVLGTEQRTDGCTVIRLGLTDDEATRALWPHPFAVEVTVVVGRHLLVELRTRNIGSEDIAYTCALHSYFTVRDIAQVRIHGLDGCTYLDTVGTCQQRQQRGPVRFDSETDRIYLNTVADCVIEDPGLGRRIRIAKTGSRATVVWNPWQEKARRMPDFGDDEYRGMVCVETSTAGEDATVLAAGAEHRVSAHISLEPRA